MDLLCNAMDNCVACFMIPFWGYVYISVDDPAINWIHSFTPRVALLYKFVRLKNNKKIKKKENKRNKTNEKFKKMKNENNKTNHIS